SVDRAGEDRQAGDGGVDVGGDARLHHRRPRHPRRQRGAQEGDGGGRRGDLGRRAGEEDRHARREAAGGGGRGGRRRAGPAGELVLFRYVLRSYAAAFLGIFA